MDVDGQGSGGGGGNNDDAVFVSVVPNPADPQTQSNDDELQPFTWLRAAPYIAVMFAGVSLIAVGLMLIGPACSSGADDNVTINNVNQCDMGIVLTITGGIMAAAAMGASTALSPAAGCCRRRLFILEADD